MRSILIVAALSILQVSALQAQESPEQLIQSAIENTLADVEITSIRKTPIDGLYEVLIGPEVVYASSDGRFILQGDLIDLRQKRNRSEEIRSSVRSTMLDGIPHGEYIEFSPENPKHIIYVFTDIDCGYCRKLHRDMPKINQRGIAVRYLAFPRAGLGSKTHKQMESVWCADNRTKAMNEAKQGMRVTQKSCENPVSKHFQLGRDIGVQGTPAIYTREGQHLSGYLPPDRLARALAGQ